MISAQHTPDPAARRLEEAALACIYPITGAIERFGVEVWPEGLHSLYLPGHLPDHPMAACWGRAEGTGLTQGELGQVTPVSSTRYPSAGY